MLKIPVLHPEILGALGRAGHLSKVLISDGNYPHISRPNPRATFVWANFTPGVLDAVSVLKMIADLVPIEAVEVMQPEKTGQYALTEDPPIWNDFRKVLRERSDFRGELTPFPKPLFNKLCSQEELCLVIATGEQQIWANCLVTIGVVR